MKVITKSVHDLKPYRRNPRNNENAIDAVANSIRDFGFRNPIIIDKNNVIIAGHTRLKAALKLGIEEVPCIVAEDLTEEQVKAFRLVDNKVAEASTWDEVLMYEELLEINGHYDMTAYGFEEDISPDQFGEDFTLRSGDKDSLIGMSVTLHRQQKELADYVISIVSQEIEPDPENNDKNGNAIAEVCRQWAALKTS